MRTAAGSGVVQRFLAFLHAHGLDNSTLAIALSGGPDSTALAIAASEAPRAAAVRVLALHVEHGVRPDSEDDRPVIAAICEELDLKLIVLRADLPGDASEDEMRSERYRLLADAVTETGAAGVLTAHHADDQAETVLLHSIRGSGLEGIAGMAPVQWRSDLDLTILRPFLHETRRSLLDLVHERSLPYLIDPTNSDPSKARNAIRLDVLPALELIHPGAAAALARLAQIARSDHEALEEVSRSRAVAYVGGDILPAAALSTESVAIQRRILRAWVGARTGLELTLNRTEALRLAILAERGGTMIELGERWAARRDGDVVRLRRGHAADEG